MSKPKLITYEIAEPIKETWLFEVKAEGILQALELHDNGESEQMCSISGWPYGCDTSIKDKAKGES